MTIRGSSSGLRAGAVATLSVQAVRWSEVVVERAAVDGYAVVFVSSVASLAVTDSVVRGATATGACAGFYVSTAAATFDNVTVARAVSGGDGAALYVAEQSTAVVARSRFADNAALGSGGAVAVAASDADSSVLASTGCVWHRLSFEGFNLDEDDEVTYAGCARFVLWSAAGGPGAYVDARGARLAARAVFGADWDFCLAPGAYELRADAATARTDPAECGTGGLTDWDGVDPAPALTARRAGEAAPVLSLELRGGDDAWRYVDAALVVDDDGGGATVFAGNAAGVGGAVAALDGASVDAVGVFVEGNAATTTSHGIAGGGGVYVDALSRASLTNCSLAGNSAPRSGGHVFTNLLSELDLIRCDLSAGAARDGGALALAGVARATVVASALRGNAASRNGGAVIMQSAAQGDRTFTLGSFSGNAAGDDGGAVYAWELTAAFAGVAFDGNEAAGDGGALILAGMDAAATTFGAACGVTLEVAADWRFTTGRNDSNYSQACPLNDREAAATITFGTCDETPTSCLWSEDPDGGGWDCGGCVCPNDGVGGLELRRVDGNASTFVAKVPLVANQRGFVADLCLEDGTYRLVAEDTVHGEGWWGGQFEALLRDEVSGATTYAVPPTAVAPGVGAAVDFDASFRKTATSATGNVAAAGGGVAFLADSGVDLSAVVLDGNGASYGPVTATPAATLVLATPGPYALSSGDALASGAARLCLLDALGSVVTSESSSLLAVSSADERVVVSSNLFRFVEGCASLDGLVATRRAGATATLNATAFVDGLAGDGVAFDVVFRACGEGEMEVAAQDAGNTVCVDCAPDEYWDAGSCYACRDGMACGGAALGDRLLATLDAERGWWRSAATASAFYRCVGDRWCPGGAGVGDDLCRDGHEGPGCASCAYPTYYFDRSSYVCERCRAGQEALTVAVCVAALAAAVAAFAYGAKYASDHAVQLQSSAVYRGASSERVLILWAAFQIIASVDHTLDVKFPRAVEDALKFLKLFELEFGLLPANCIVKYSIYEKLLMQTVAPITVVLLLGAAAPLHARLRPRARGVLGLHAWAALFCLFVVYPATSNTIAEVLRRCERYDDAWSHGYVAADVSKRCGTATNGVYRAYAGAMLAVVTLGTPASYFAILFRYRAKICPPAKRENAARRIRDADPDLEAISFLFRKYRPAMLYGEPYDMARRVALIVAVSFCGKATGGLRASAGLFLSMAFLMVGRDLSLYNDRLTNVLSHAANWAVFVVFVSAFLVKNRPFGYENQELAAVLFAVMAVLLGTFVITFLRDRSQSKLNELRLREMEFREIEGNLDVAQLRGDVLRLRTRYEPDLLTLERDSLKLVPDMARANEQLGKQPSTLAEVASHRGSVVELLADAVTAPAARLRESLLPSRAASVREPTISFTTARYPCYVIPLSRLRDLDVLPTHEAALDAGLLEVLTPNGAAPNSAFTYFISQNWETFGESPHPDNARHTKLRWLKNMRRHMRIPAAVDEVWIWWDLVSVPQARANRREQLNAIHSLCYYAQLCSRFIPLVRDERAWLELYGESLKNPVFPTAGTLETYAARGWCRLEILAALAPKKFSTGAWRPGPRSVRFRYHHDPRDAGVGPVLSPELLRDPTRGNFTDPADADVVRPVLRLIADRYAEYARSGSDAWDATVDVHARPDWLKRIAGVDPDAREATFLGDVPRFTENEDQWRARACSSPPRLAGAPATAPARLD